MSHNGNWISVSLKNLCPICGKPDNCQISSNGLRVYCGRVSQGSIKTNKGGQFLHLLSGTYQIPLPPPIRPRSRETKDFSGLAKRLAAEGAAGRHSLAVLLGVKDSALERLGVGWNQHAQTWSFPERDATGKVIGINDRYLNGSKKRRYGGKAGLTFATDWDAGDGPILLVEGGSDTAALLGIGMNVVGRPSNRAGVSLLADLLEFSWDAREIVVIGERDQKENGDWPGRDGAISTAQQLSEELNRFISWSLPPDDAKDARAWLLKMPELSDESLRDLFLSGLDKKIIEPPLRFSCEQKQGPVVDLKEWRAQMVKGRIDSLNKPGCYLDASTTGAGKSHADFVALMHALSMEAA